MIAEKTEEQKQLAMKEAAAIEAQQRLESTSAVKLEAQERELAAQAARDEADRIRDEVMQEAIPQSELLQGDRDALAMSIEVSRDNLKVKKDDAQ